MPESVSTERLILRPLTFADVEPVSTGSPRAANWSPGYPTEGDRVSAMMYGQALATGSDPQPWGTYQLIRGADGIAIGAAGFHSAPNDAGVVEIGFGVAPEVEGQGYATEALRALIRIAADNGAKVVVGGADPDNVASQKVQLHAGMTPVGEVNGMVRFALVLPG
jgi:RimJ/RimL family protein N-acetyltransferase